MKYSKKQTFEIPMAVPMIPDLGQHPGPIDASWTSLLMILDLIACHRTIAND